MKLRLFVVLFVVAAVAVSADDKQQTTDGSHTGFKPQITKQGSIEKLRHEVKLKEDAKEAALEGEINQFKALIKAVPELSREQKIKQIDKDFQFESETDVTCLLKVGNFHVQLPLHFVFVKNSDNAGSLGIKMQLVKDRAATLNEFDRIQFRQRHLIGLQSDDYKGYVHNRDGKTGDPMDLGETNSEFRIRLYRQADGSYLLTGARPNGNPLFICPRKPQP